MKKNDPYEIAKKSMFFNNFIYNEIVKRHIEEYEPEICNDFGRILIEMKKDYVNYENNFLVIIGQALDQYRIKKNFCTPVLSPQVRQMMEDCPELFDFNNLHRLYKWLYTISEKYNVNATEIPFPSDMEDIVINFSKDFYPPVLYVFNSDVSNSFRMSYDSETKLSGVILKPLTEDDSNKLKYQFIVDRIIKGEDINTLDKNFFNEYCSQNQNKHIRIDSFIKYIIGLHCWDVYKERRDIKSGYELYQKYQIKMKECNGSKCFSEMEYDTKFKIPNGSKKEDFYCNSVETCKKFVREAFKLVGTCIRDYKLYNSTKDSTFVQPESKIHFQRKKLSFFQ